ncbi:MAG: MFS transporter [Actinomycetia bacterium]|nr:MFS transporter [Actinomycetes bacterium]
MSRYRRLWALPGAATLVVGGFLGRIGSGVTVVAWVILIRQTRGSYAEAAAVASALGLATAAASPVVGRLADRRSLSRVLLWCTVAYVVTQLLLLAAVQLRASLPLLVLVAAVSGSTLPPLSAGLRTTWSRLTGPDTEQADLRSTAMAAESALLELAYVLGPLLLSAVVLVTARLVPGSPHLGPAAAIGLASLCTLVGTVWVGWGRAVQGVRPQPPTGPVHWSGPLRSGGFPLLLATAAGVMFAFGAAPVAITAYCEQSHPGSGSSVTGVLIAVWSLGSALAGLVFGALAVRAPLRTQYLVLLGGLAVGYLLWLAAPTTGLLAVVLFVTGAVIAPVLAVMAGLVAGLTPVTMRTEAYTWLTTTSNGVSALGAGVAGLVVDSSAGAEGGFVLAAVSTAAGLVLATRLPPVSERSQPV